MKDSLLVVLVFGVGLGQGFLMGAIVCRSLDYWLGNKMQNALTRIWSYAKPKK